jgi:uncharacterized protein DUF222
MSSVTAPASARDALDMIQAALGFLAAADAAERDPEEQALVLRELELDEAVLTAARAWSLAAFTAAQGHCGDGDYSPRAWLMHHTGITRGAAAAHTAWARRTAGHRLVLAALAARQVTESYGRAICGWTDKLPEESRDAADEILLAAAGTGMAPRDLAELAGEMYQRSRPELPDEDPARGFDDRGVRLETTFGGAGVMSGDLTPECAAIVGTVLDALSAPVGAEDTRSHTQRYHDALQEAMRRLAASDLLPERAGQPVKAWVHMSLADLLRLQGSSALLEQWTAQVRARWAARRAGASEGGGGGAWLDGDAAGAIICDAAMAPVVTGEVNVDALDELVRLCVLLDRHRRGTGDGTADAADNGGADAGGRAHAASGAGGAGASAGARAGGRGGDGDGAEATGGADGADATGGADGAGGRDGARRAGGPSPGWEAVERAVIGTAVDLLSGPGGLASFLRRRQLGARLGGPSLPLDIGYSTTIPAGIRNAVILRDRHCRWPGGCDQPAAACQVHHTRHLANGGSTSLKDCVLLCPFHHQVVIHRQGWTLVLNRDGTTTAWNKDQTKVLHSHGPPARPGLPIPRDCDTRP